MVDGNCKESVDENKRLIAEEVDPTFDVKISIISLSVNKTFLTMHMFNNSVDGFMDLLKGKQLEQIQHKFLKLSSPNVRNLVAYFKHRLRCGYIDSILELKSKSRYDYIQKCCF
jgi:hypothetical protein